MIAIHKKYRVLTSGSLKFLVKAYQGLSYARFSKNEQIIVAINNSEEAMQMEIPVWEAGVSRSPDCQLLQLLCTHNEGYTVRPCYYTAVGGYLDIQLPAYGAVVLWHKD